MAGMAGRSAPQAAEVNWPFVGPLFGGVQRLVPRVQVVLTPHTVNLAIPMRMRGRSILKTATCSRSPLPRL